MNDYGFDNVTVFLDVREQNEWDIEHIPGLRVRVVPERGKRTFFRDFTRGDVAASKTARTRALNLLVDHDLCIVVTL